MINADFFSRRATAVARDLLGKRLVRIAKDEKMSGMIVETEAYSGLDDLASHGRARKTPRNLPMFGQAGTIYIYLIYGNYHMLNIVCEPEGHPAAVLIRAIEPDLGTEHMKKRRKKESIADLCSGPGKLAQALAVTKDLNDIPLGDYLYVENGKDVSDSDVLMSPRIGLGKSVSEPWFSIPWRFYLKDNPFVSHPKKYEPIKYEI